MQNHSLVKDNLKRLRKTCSNFALVKEAYKGYAEVLEKEGRYIEALNVYIEILLYMKSSDADYDSIEKRVKELQKIILGGISIKNKLNTK